MIFSQAVFVPDLVHDQKTYYAGGQRSMSNGFFSLVKEPVRQACGIEISLMGSGKGFGFSTKSRQASLRQSEFDNALFQDLARAGHDGLRPFWEATYHHMGEAATDYLFAHIQLDALLMAFDMPPWLRQACTNRGIRFLDMRHSPLRFGRDLYIALRSNDPTLQSRMKGWQTPAEELRLEASLLAANLQIHRGRGEENLRYHFDLDDCFVFVGQHPLDPALLKADGCYRGYADHVQRLRELAAGRRALYLPDWSTHLKSEETPLSMADHARSALADVLGMPVQACTQSIYQVLAAHESPVLAGLNAPALQEAAWFDQATAYQMEPACVPLTCEAIPASESYVQVHFQDFIAPVFWHTLLAPDMVAPRTPRLPALSRHCGREMLDLWGDYEKVLTWQRTVPLATFDRSGGGLLRDRVETLVQQQARAGSPPGREVQDSPFASARAIAKLHNSKLGQTAYVLGNGPSLNGFDLSELMARESFWCNRAFEMERQGIEFRPRYYFWGDQIGAQMFANDILTVQAGLKFFRSGTYQILRKNHSDRLALQPAVWYDCRETFGMDMHDDAENFSYDPGVMLFSGWSVVLEAIQFAYYMGYTRVYVAGVDLDYSKANYFFPSNGNDIGAMDCTLDAIGKSFTVARNHFERNGRVLAKITQSPNLPLEFFDDSSLIRRPLDV